MVPLICGQLRDWGQECIQVTYGFGCNLSVEDLWRPEEVHLSELDAYIQHSDRVGIFRFGECDLHIEDAAERLEFVLCHESDIHFASVDEIPVRQVIALWRGEGLTIYVSPGPKGSAGPRTWERLE